MYNPSWTKVCRKTNYIINQYIVHGKWNSQYKYCTQRPEKVNFVNKDYNKFAKFRSFDCCFWFMILSNFKTLQISNDICFVTDKCFHHKKFSIMSQTSTFYYVIVFITNSFSAKGTLSLFSLNIFVNIWHRIKF